MAISNLRSVRFGFGDPDLELKADSYNIWEIFIIYNIYTSSWSVLSAHGGERRKGLNSTNPPPVPKT